MKHIEPTQLQGVDEPRHARRPGSRVWLGLATALCLGLGGLATAMFDGNLQDRVTDAERSERLARIGGLPALQLAVVAPERLDESLGRMGLQPNESVTLRAMLFPATGEARGGRAALATRTQGTPAALSAPVPAQRAPVRLVELAVWDTHAADGDVIAIASAGYRRELVLTKAVQVVAVPVDASGLLAITGIRDGGGGITLGVRGSSQTVLMPIMSEGQTIALPTGK